MIFLDGFFFIRICYVIICYIALGFSIYITKEPVQVFTSLLLFYLPLSLDYWNHKPVTEKDSKRRKMGIIAPGITSAILMGLLMSSSQINFGFINTFGIKYIVFVISGYFIWLAIEDFVAYSGKEENLQRSKWREKHRKEVLDNRLAMDERMNYYQKAKTKQYVVQHRKSKKKRKGNR